MKGNRSGIFNEGSQKKSGGTGGKTAGEMSRDDPIYLQAEASYVVP